MKPGELGPEMTDLYLQKIQEHWDEITGMYLTFEEKGPVIELDANGLLIVAYPAQEYLDGLSDRTREQAKRTYRIRLSSRSSQVIFCSGTKTASTCPGRLKGTSLLHRTPALFLFPDSSAR